MVKVSFYNNVSNFNNNGIVKAIKVTMQDFIRYLSIAGGIQNNGSSSNAYLFYEYMVRMALEDVSGTFKITSDYSNSEQSIKAAVSYFIGMLSSYAIAEKHYKIPHLFHLKDSNISYQQKKNSNKVPDFFGLSNGPNPLAYLIEAKGTWKTKLDIGTIEKGIEQVKSIRKVKFEESPGMIRTFKDKDLNKHVTGSYFENDELHFCDIDPDYQGDLVCHFNANVAILRYYKNLLSLLSTNSEYIEVGIEEGLEFTFVNFKDYKIGINNSVLEAIVGSFGEKNLTVKTFLNDRNLIFERLSDDKYLSVIKESNLYNTISEITNNDYHTVNEKFDNTSVSFGRDGLIVIKS
ncbi:hypothetical protein [Streptococcus parasanguinis]